MTGKRTEIDVPEAKQDAPEADLLRERAPGRIDVTEAMARGEAPEDEKDGDTPEDKDTPSN